MVSNGYRILSVAGNNAFRLKAYQAQMSEASVISNAKINANDLINRIVTGSEQTPDQSSRSVNHFDLLIQEDPSFVVSSNSNCVAEGSTAASTKSTHLSGLPQASAANDVIPISTSQSSLFPSTQVNSATKTTPTVQHQNSTPIYLPSYPTSAIYKPPIEPQMISADSLYNMTHTPVFVAPSVYPQVTVIPEGDLLRSMIVQDVKQVTQKLLDKHSKRKRGKRNRKEKVIPGNYGTLKVNFKKFFAEQPPMTEPVPKRTVYQRIAPRYPVTFTESSCKRNLAATAGTTQVALRDNNKTNNEHGTVLMALEDESEKKSRDSFTSDKPRLDSSGLNLGSFLQGTKQAETSPGLNLGTQANLFIDSLLSPTGTGHTTQDKDPPNSDNVLYSNTLNESNTAVATTVSLSAVTVSAGDLLGDSKMNTTTEVNRSSMMNPTMNMNQVNDINPTELWSRDNYCNGLESKLHDVTSQLISTTNDSNALTPTTMSAVDNIFYQPAINDVEPSGPISSMLDGDVSVSSPGVVGNELNSLLSEFYSEFSCQLYEKMDSIDGAESIAETLQTSAASTAFQTPPSCTETTSVVTSLQFVGDPIGENSASMVTNDSLWNCSFESNGSFTGPENIKQLENDAYDQQRVRGEENGSFVANNGDTNMEITQLEITASRGLLEVIDISPEYASSEGGGKIILIGSWNQKEARYSCRFGDKSVPADLIQNGVLRCYCPPNKPGKVEVVVLSDDTVLSKSVDFEYVDTEEVEMNSKESKQHDWLFIEEEYLRQLLIERSEALCHLFDSTSCATRLKTLGKTASKAEMEDVLTGIYEILSSKTLSLPCDVDYKCEAVMTILHLAAALGCTKLIQGLCSWVETNNNVIITEEANPRKQDQFKLTPLMWTCAKGKFDTMCVLLQWDETTSWQTDRCGCTPLSISRDQGHTTLERYLEKSQAKGQSRSSLLSDNGSPLLCVRGTMSRSSSTASQLEQSRESQISIDDNISGDTWSNRRSPSAIRLHNDKSPDKVNGHHSVSRTLGQTLAHVQAIIQDGVDDRDDNQRSTPLTSIDLDDDGFFTNSTFSRTRSGSNDDSRHGNQTPRSSLSSLSPGSPVHTTNVQSPFDPSSQDTAEFCEFFYNSDRILEKDFAELTLTDEEQRNLYKAASVIQNAYKSYRERRKQRDNELTAAVLIQSYYRRYKQYATFKRMQRGAVVIQHKYRAHREKEKQKCHAASVIQSYYRRYKERKQNPSNSNYDLQQKTRKLQQSDRRMNRFRQQTGNRTQEFGDTYEDIAD